RGERRKFPVMLWGGQKYRYASVTRRGKSAFLSRRAEDMGVPFLRSRSEKQNASCVIEAGSVTFLPYQEDDSMMLRRLLLSSLCTVVAMVLAWTTCAIASPIEFINSGANAVAIQGTVDAFRTALGNPNNGNAAGTTGGRREINWDGGNVALTDTTP